MVGSVTKGAWSGEEDSLLRKCIEKYGEGKWHQVPVRAGLNRCRKSCRLRWLNYLRPNIKKGNFSPDEIDLIMRFHRLLGNRWSIIAARLPGRTANQVKNYWSTQQSMKYKRKQETDFGTTKLTEATTPESNVLKPRPRTLIRPNIISSYLSGNNKLATINPSNNDNDTFKGIPSNEDITDEAFSSPLALENSVEELFRGLLETINPNNSDINDNNDNNTFKGIQSNENIAHDAFSSPPALQNTDLEFLRGLLENDAEKSEGIWPTQLNGEEKEGEKAFWWEEIPIFNDQGNNEGNGAGDYSSNKFENETLIWDNYVNESAFDMDIWDISDMFKTTQ